MKKIILGICANGSKRVNHNGGTTNNEGLKLMIIDTTREGEEDYEFPVIPLKPNAYNRLSWEVLSDILSPENQIYLLVPREDEDPLEKEISKNTIGLIRNMLTLSDFSLTRQEMKIMDLTDEGATAKEIAAKLNKSYHTIKNQRSKIYIKMGVKSKEKAIDLYRDYRKRMN